MKPGSPPALGVWSPSQWTTREVPVLRILVNRFTPHSGSYFTLKPGPSNLHLHPPGHSHAFTHTHTHTHSPTHVHEHSFGHKRSCLRSQSHTHRYTHSQALTRTHNHTYLSTHIQKYSQTTENTGTYAPCWSCHPRSRDWLRCTGVSFNDPSTSLCPVVPGHPAPDLHPMLALPGRLSQTGPNPAHPHSSGPSTLRAV